MVDHDFAMFLLSSGFIFSLRRAWLFGVRLQYGMTYTVGKPNIDTLPLLCISGSMDGIWKICSRDATSGPGALPRPDGD